MKQLKFFVLAGFAAVLVSGCANQNIGKVSGMQTTRDNFKAALHKEYVALAVAEDKEQDSDDAEYFIQKAKNAGLGLDVIPQLLNERTLPGKTKGQLAKARSNLVNKLWQGAAENTPKASARAQAMFDCWMQEQEENNQPDHIRACRQAYAAAYFDMKVTPKMMKPMKKMAAPARMPAPFVVYFSTDSADVSDREMTKIKQAYADYRLRKPGKIIVAGHTDTQGNKDYNLGLSRHRAAEVGNQLMQLGVPRKIVHKSRYGEIAPVIDSGDNKAEGNNRRVTITFLR